MNRLELSIDRRFVGVTSTCVLALGLCLLAWFYWPMRLTKGDAVGQFFPMSLEGYRAVAQGELPLFNFFQFLGHPILEVGYYPVLYPLWWIACYLSEHLLREPQQAWNVAGFLQLILSAVAGYLFCATYLRLGTVLSIAGGVSVGFIGCGIFLSDWFYGIVNQAYVPLLLVGFRALILAPSLRNALLVAAVGACFVFSSNIQFLFYAAHFLALGVVAIFAEQFVVGHAKDSFKKCWKYMVVSVSLGALFIAPYMYGFFRHTQLANRELSSVTPDKYFWTTNHPWLSLTYAWFPVSGFGVVSWQDPWIYHLGFIPMVGVVLSPLVLWWQVRRGSYQAAVISAYLIFCAVVAFLLSLGAAGGIGWLLYHVQPYNWFRHSIKWMPFYQVFSVLLGFWSVGESIRIIPRRSFQVLVSWVVLGVTVAGLISFVLTVNQSKSMTDTDVPLPRPTLGSDPNYRHVGLWPGGELYGGGDMHGRLLCHNASSIWRLPTFGGYEPLINKSNLAAVLNSWHPGCFLDYASFDLPTLVAWGVRYIRVPPEAAPATIEELRKRFPKYQIKDLGLDESLKVHVLEVEDAPALVQGRWSRADRLVYEGNSVFGTVTTSKPDTLVLRWLHNPHFVVTLNGKRAEIRQDARGRVLVRIPRAGQYDLRLRYYPKGLIVMYWICASAALGVVFAIWLRRLLRPIR